MPRPVAAALTHADAEDVALTITAQAVVAAGLARVETRGCHHRDDYPDTDPAQARSSTVRPGVPTGAQSSIARAGRDVRLMHLSEHEVGEARG